MADSHERQSMFPEAYSERDILESMRPDALVDLILAHGEKVSSYERTMNLAAEVLEGYGTSVEEELQKRESERQNGTT